MPPGGVGPKRTATLPGCATDGAEERRDNGAAVPNEGRTKGRTDARKKGRNKTDDSATANAAPSSENNGEENW